MKVDKEISHPSHPQHKLKMEYTDVPFSCDGCKEAGIGLKYRCDTCDFDLHKNCALASPTISHPFYKKCDFQFYTKPPGSLMRYCDACGNDVLGFVYHCNNCGFDLHPCCSNLPQTLEDGDGHHFYLCWKIAHPCHRCGRKGIGWSYRSECKNYNLHVSCVKELLVESWQELYFAREKVQVNRDIHRKIPILKGTLKNHHKGKGGKVRKCCEIAAGAVSVIISAILGDPTALLVAAIGAFISK